MWHRNSIHNSSSDAVRCVHRFNRTSTAGASTHTFKRFG
ncbi:hypothetical protein BURPS305_3787 [Burkholderia pseudomallei 305]|uniref:Uncharacterized protein n=1 Tax=Burkholderia pseudomallei 1710a TaxID=320371 RepID=A0A0E1W1Q5_BURPE|nr:conserved hypothetical protein [Burkholderia pseudomallei MSHR346]EBA48541.1 hypothetical protein BURPS305_3787 [Burkholderia pseudomallei 305]EEC35885.1 conserved hypothetical protein [Burkholderia pseudomallei 576]EEH30089.1 conserved hypothetical protein [Burkholderia pseudomallei Pakistan 9]EET07063.1 hypothetical protein BURPS1710A_3514 [Burkholderia pseudomallei 1710a]